MDGGQDDVLLVAEGEDAHEVAAAVEDAPGVDGSGCGVDVDLDDDGERELQGFDLACCCILLSILCLFSATNKMHFVKLLCLAKGKSPVSTAFSRLAGTKENDDRVQGCSLQEVWKITTIPCTANLWKNTKEQSTNAHYAKAGFQARIRSFTSGTNECLCTVTEARGMVLALIREKNNEFMIRDLVQSWSNHNVMIRKLSHFSHYLDWYFISRRSLAPLKEVGLACFQELIYQEIKGQVKDAVIALIDKECEGEQIDRALLKNVLDIFVEIGLGQMECFENDFLDFLLKDTTEYYSVKAQSWILEHSCPDYMIKKLQNELLAQYATPLLEKENSGHSALLRDDKVEDLFRTYRRFSKITRGLQPISNMFRTHVTNEGTALVKQAEDSASNKAALLLLFNGSDRLSHSEIVTQLNLSADDVVRLLHSLSCAKYKILTKEPANRSISPNDVFRFNSKFTGRMRRIKIPLPPVDETKKVVEGVDKDRRCAIDASIVRIMETCKVMGHQQLVAECVEQLSRRFKPDFKAIKKRIEDLGAWQGQREYVQYLA